MYAVRKAMMASQNKKNKARNSYFYNGGEKDTIKMKRVKYFNKKQRNELKQETKQIVQ